MAETKNLNEEADLFTAAAAEPTEALAYTDDNIQHVEGLEHIRMRPGMYIGGLGDGSRPDDGIYVLLKEVLDNSIDEFRMKEGSIITLTIEDGTVTVRDRGRGIPQGKLVDCVSQVNTSGKFDSRAFKRSVGLNGVGLKAANALSERFEAASFRDGKLRRVTYEKGELVSDTGIIDDTEGNERGTMIQFKPDSTLFVGYHYHEDTIKTMLKNFTYLNAGLAIIFNGKRFYSKSGLPGLLSDNMTQEPLYQFAHFKGENIEIAFTHCDQNGDEYYSFVNGQYTIQGGAHQSAFKSAIVKTVQEFYKKNFAADDVRQGLVAAINVDVQEPVFESQTKVKLGPCDMEPKGGVSVNKYVTDFVKKALDDFLFKNSETADAILAKIQASERERKEIDGITKTSKEKQKKISLNNKKLRDCVVHFSDTKVTSSKTCEDLRTETSIFITEGLSASSSITACRDANYQAVFSLRGKPENSYGKSRQLIYKNEELSLLQAALGIESDMEALRYNKVIIATDADVDGMHIRLLLLSFFLQFYPDLVKKGHVYILQTPLFRVRDKQRTFYCYTEEERLKAIETIGQKRCEITRFKGLGEISASEFKNFIGAEMRLDQIQLRKDDAVGDILAFYMGDNTRERQNFIIDNLVVEEDEAEA